MAYAEAHADTYADTRVPTDLKELYRLDDWEVADGETDPRHRDLVGPDGGTRGRIDELLVSPSTEKAHFAVVYGRDGIVDELAGARFLLPMDRIRLDGKGAYCPFGTEQFRDAPRWHPGDNPDRHYRYWIALAAGGGRTAGATASPAAAGDSLVMPVVAEELHVGKRQVATGGVRITSRVVERPVEESVRLREEHIHVDRRPADRAATPADLDAAREGVVEVTATAERPVVSKEARVVEELVVGKEVGQRTETVQGTVRRTEVDIDEDDGQNGRNAAR